MSKFDLYLESIHPDKQFDVFFNSYLTTALWSSTDDNDDHLDHKYDFSDFDKESYDKLKQEAKKFFDETYDMISSDLKQAGHDFWLTRCGHGAGFWDGDWHDEIGDKLTKISDKYGNIDIYVGDDGKLHV